MLMVRCDVSLTLCDSALMSKCVAALQTYTTATVAARASCVRSTTLGLHWRVRTVFVLWVEVYWQSHLIDVHHRYQCLHSSQVVNSMSAYFCMIGSGIRRCDICSVSRSVMQCWFAVVGIIAELSVLQWSDAGSATERPVKPASVIAESSVLGEPGSVLCSCRK